MEQAVTPEAHVTGEPIEYLNKLESLNGKNPVIQAMCCECCSLRINVLI